MALPKNEKIILVDNKKQSQNIKENKKPKTAENIPKQNKITKKKEKKNRFDEYISIPRLEMTVQDDGEYRFKQNIDIVNSYNIKDDMDKWLGDGTNSRKK